MQVHVLYASSTGTAETAADQISALFRDGGCDTTQDDLMDINPSDLSVDDLNVFVCSTYGEGELPTAAELFFDDLKAQAPDLSNFRIAVFGLGDIIYEKTFNFGSQIVIRELEALGATQIVEAAQFDNSAGIALDDATKDWVQTVLAASTVS